MPNKALDDVASEADWATLVEHVASGRLSLLDLIKTHQPERDDYFSHVQYSRAFAMLMTDVRVLERLRVEIHDVIERSEADSRPTDLEAVGRSKDAVRRFLKLSDFHQALSSTGPSLLGGSTFEECLAQYLRITEHLEKLWTDSADLYRRGHYPLATFTAILLLEEMGKVGRLWHELLAYDAPKAKARTLTEKGRNHRLKAFAGVVAGALVNARLDRILGLEAVRRLLQEAESGRLEQVRQACLYIDFVDGSVVTPSERIDEEQARLFVVFAGEIWAETFGNLPSEFKRMIDLVSAFERELGYNDEQIYGRTQAAG